MVTHTGTFSSVGKIRPYSSSERSSTCFCQMSHVLQREGQLNVTETVRFTGSCCSRPVAWATRYPARRASSGTRFFMAPSFVGRHAQDAGVRRLPAAHVVEACSSRALLRRIRAGREPPTPLLLRSGLHAL